MNVRESPSAPTHQLTIPAVCWTRSLAWLFVLLFWASALLAQPLASKSQTEVSFSEPAFDRASNTFDITATITNTSDELWPPPILLVLSRLHPRGVALTNGSGTTLEGKPYMTVLASGVGLRPGETVSGIRLKFRHPTQAKFSFANEISRPRVPVADAGPDVSAKVSLPGTIDGSNSYDPDSRLITFNWTIAQAPQESVAKVAASSPAPTSFRTAPVCTYVLRLQASDGEWVAEDSVRVTATARNLAPIGDAGDDQRITQAGPMTLSGDASAARVVLRRRDLRTEGARERDLQRQRTLGESVELVNAKRVGGHHES